MEVSPSLGSSTRGIVAMGSKMRGEGIRPAGLSYLILVKHSFGRSSPSTEMSGKIRSVRSRDDLPVFRRRSFRPKDHEMRHGEIRSKADEDGSELRYKNLNKIRKGDDRRGRQK